MLNVLSRQDVFRQDVFRRNVLQQNIFRRGGRSRNLAYLISYSIRDLRNMKQPRSGCEWFQYSNFKIIVKKAHNISIHDYVIIQ